MAIMVGGGKKHNSHQKNSSSFALFAQRQANLLAKLLLVDSKESETGGSGASAAQEVRVSPASTHRQPRSGCENENGSITTGAGGGVECSQNKMISVAATGAPAQPSENQNQSTFDVIVLGSGLKQVILTYLLAEAGKKVLQIELSEKNSQNIDTQALHLLKHLKKREEPEYNFRDPFAPSWSDEQILIDQAPRLCLASGRLSRFLVATGLAREVEFHRVGGVFLARRGGGGGRVEKIPLNEQEASDSPLLSWGQKQCFKAFMHYVVNFNEHDGKETYRGLNVHKVAAKWVFRSFMLAEDTQYFIGHALALNSDDGYLDRPAVETIRAVQRYVSSFFKFGAAPFLWHYGGRAELARTAGAAAAAARRARRRGGGGGASSPRGGRRGAGGKAPAAAASGAASPRGTPRRRGPLGGDPVTVVPCPSLAEVEIGSPSGSGGGGDSSGGGSGGPEKGAPAVAVVGGRTYRGAAVVADPGWAGASLRLRALRRRRGSQSPRRKAAGGGHLAATPSPKGNGKGGGGGGVLGGGGRGGAVLGGGPTVARAHCLLLEPPAWMAEAAAAGGGEEEPDSAFLILPPPPPAAASAASGGGGGAPAVLLRRDAHVVVATHLQGLCPQGMVVATITKIAETNDPASELDYVFEYLPNVIKRYDDVRELGPSFQMDCEKEYGFSCLFSDEFSANCTYEEDMEEAIAVYTMLTDDRANANGDPAAVSRAQMVLEDSLGSPPTGNGGTPTPSPPLDDKKELICPGGGGEETDDSLSEAEEEAEALVGEGGGVAGFGPEERMESMVSVEEAVEDYVYVEESAYDERLSKMSSPVKQSLSLKDASVSVRLSGLDSRSDSSNPSRIGAGHYRSSTMATKLDSLPVEGPNEGQGTDTETHRWSSSSEEMPVMARNVQGSTLTESDHSNPELSVDLSKWRRRRKQGTDDPDASQRQEQQTSFSSKRRDPDVSHHRWQDRSRFGSKQRAVHSRRWSSLAIGTAGNISLPGRGKEDEERLSELIHPATMALLQDTLGEDMTRRSLLPKRANCYRPNRRLTPKGSPEQMPLEQSPPQSNTTRKERGRSRSSTTGDQVSPATQDQVSAPAPRASAPAPRRPHSLRQQGTSLHRPRAQSLRPHFKNTSRPGPMDMSTPHRPTPNMTMDTSLAHCPRDLSISRRRGSHSLRPRGSSQHRSQATSQRAPQKGTPPQYRLPDALQQHRGRGGAGSWRQAPHQKRTISLPPKYASISRDVLLRDDNSPRSKQAGVRGELNESRGALGTSPLRSSQLCQSTHPRLEDNARSEGPSSSAGKMEGWRRQPKRTSSGGGWVRSANKNDQSFFRTEKIAARTHDDQYYMAVFDM